MRLLTSVLVVALAACAPPAPTPTTSLSAPVTVTSPVSSTTAASSPATTAPAESPEAASCDTPPVTFALLCDVYELLQANHVDAPLDPAALAAGAALGVSGFDAASAESGPASTACAIPHPAFVTICDTIVERLQAGPFDVEGAIEAGVSSMIALSLDPFTYYVPPELSGALSEDGIINAVGLLLNITNQVGSVCTVVEGDCRLEVAVALLDSPAYEAGIEPGDVITAIEGETVDGLTLVEVAGLLDGEEGTPVTVELSGKEGAPRQVTMDRSLPPTPQLIAEQPRPGVGYVRLPDFEMDIPAFFHTVLAEFNQADINTMVLDLRDNPGGFVDVATLVASEFFSDGVVFRTRGPEGNLEYPVQDGGIGTGIGVTVVVNTGSASAAEILAGVLQERGRAAVVGAPTFGKDAVQIGLPLRNDGQLRVTIARWVTPDGTSVSGTGVVPDVLVDIPADSSPEEVIDLALGQS